MIDKIRQKLKSKNNHGSSFVLVIVATTFMCVLASALLLGALMTYKLKYYKLNSLNNFYEVETALDEIYAGVGAATNEHLYTAYTTTAELVVVYDTENKEYTNLSNADANKLFKKLFIAGVTEDANYKTATSASKTMESFVSNLYNASKKKDGVQVDTTKFQVIFTDENGKRLVQTMNGSRRESGYNSSEVVSITFKNICVKRSVSLAGTTEGTYVQSITTDLVLTQPEYDVSFDMSNSTSSNLYEYAVIADMGVEVGQGDKTKTASVNVKGNIYAASDYYNKDYNDDAATKVTNKYESAPTTKWGTTDSSAYSGIFVNGEGTVLNMSSDVVVCSGSLASFNGANINLIGRSNTTSELWTDNIIIDGTISDTINNGKISMAANAYVFDDTELNAEGSKFTMTQGSYFGYSYNANDTRSIDYLKYKGYIATNYKLRSHFSDSAIIVNGKNSTLDIKALDSLYIAGKSYIEFSKVAVSSIADKYKYDSSTASGTVDGRTDDQKSKYGVSVDANADYTYTNLEDYSTGQSLDVKTNQLIFLAQWNVVENSEKTENGITTVELKFPSTYKNNTKLKELYSVLKGKGTNMNDENLTFTAIKQSVSGHDYYYLYVDSTSKNQNGVTKAEEFAEKYYETVSSADEVTMSSLYNVRDYESFKVNLSIPQSLSSVKTGAAITNQAATADTLYLQSSASTTGNVETALNNVMNGESYNNLLGTNNDEKKKEIITSIKANAEKLQGSATATSTEKMSNLLSYMYINMKDHLSVSDKKDDSDKDVNAWSIAGYTEDSGLYGYKKVQKKNSDKVYTHDGYSYDYSITPLNYYVDFKVLFDKKYSMNEEVVVGGAKVIVYSDDVTVKSTNSDGSVEGIIIAGGDVTFDESVKSFRGLIITGSKLKLTHDITISADASFVASVLKKCAESSDEELRKLVLGEKDSTGTVKNKLIKTYTSSTDESKSTVTGSTISDISYEDILMFQNWKKNVN